MRTIGNKGLSGKALLLLVVGTAMVAVSGCTQCGPAKRDFNRFEMDLFVGLKDTVAGREWDKGAASFRIDRQREATLIIDLLTYLPGPSGGPEGCYQGYVNWITAMDVVSDADWDAAHPAGTSLADLVVVSVDIPTSFASLRDTLSKMVFDEALHKSLMRDPKLPGPTSIHMGLALPNPPRPGRHVFTVKVSKSNERHFEQRTVPVIWN